MLKKNENKISTKQKNCIKKNELWARLLSSSLSLSIIQAKTQEISKTKRTKRMTVNFDRNGNSPADWWTNHTRVILHPTLYI